jgi:hypothetical protein
VETTFRTAVTEINEMSRLTKCALAVVLIATATGSAQTTTPDLDTRYAQAGT